MVLKEGMIMFLSLLLIQQISKMFIMIFIGFLVIKIKIMRESESKSLSTLILYVITPCAIINSFQIELTEDKLYGLALAGFTALIVNVLYIILTHILSKLFSLTSIEKASIIYSNAGNLIIPLVSSILGEEWVLYTAGYIVVQTILLWTHANSLVSGIKSFSLKKIFLNINIIAIIIGFTLFITEIELPFVLNQAISSIAAMIGPLAMFIIGMLIGEIDLEKMFKNKKIYFICFFRLLLLPLIIVFMLVFSGLLNLHKDASQIFVITLLAASAPCAATITQFAQVYDKDANYASMINVVSVILCIITMPLIIMTYQLLI